MEPVTQELTDDAQVFCIRCASVFTQLKHFDLLEDIYQNALSRAFDDVPDNDFEVVETTPAQLYPDYGI